MSGRMIALDAMSKALASGFLILSFFISISAADSEFPHCNCDEEGFWSIETILECQKISDFFIAVAYFSIPIELLYFVSCANIPFKWVLFQFIAFIVLCGMTHLLNAWSYEPHSFQLMLALTIFKLLTALVSFATAITLLTLIPLLLKIKVREILLEKKTWELDREVGIIKMQKEAGWHVRMLTHEIRKSLDRHTILHTTLVELSNTLALQNCAVWMPNGDKTEMSLTHELKGRKFSSARNPPISTTDDDVREINGNDGVKILNPESALSVASSEGINEPGAVAAIRMPMLKVSNFKGGTPQMVPACYAILVLVLPYNRSWSDQELEIVEVVADQVAVALSHASILEESQNMREKLVDQNRALQQAKQDALMASQARTAFQMVMSNGLRRPMHSVLGLLSVLQDEKSLGNEDQHLLIDTMVKTSDVLSNLITDVMDTSTKDDGRFPLDMRSFGLHSMIKEIACLSKCLCAYRGYEFVIEVDKFLLNNVLGDEKRLFQVILHMVGNLLNGGKGGGCLTLRVYSANGSGSKGWNEQRWGGQWRSNSTDGYAHVRLEVGIIDNQSRAVNVIPYDGQKFSSGVGEGRSFSACRKLVQLMQGDIWVVSNPEGFDQSMALVLRYQVRPSIITGVISEPSNSSDNLHSHTNFKGLKVLLADADELNRAVTRKLLEKLGCNVSVVASGYDCLNALGPSVSSFQVVFLDLHLPDLDGFEICMNVRKFRSRSWPLIVALTTRDAGEMRDRCAQTGMNGVIQKPGSFKQMANELTRILGQAR